MTKLPKKITPCPIIDAVVEFRFKSNLNSNAIFGVAYQALHKNYSTVVELPILQLPSAVRAEPNLKFQPHYQLKNGLFVVQIGPNVFSLTKPGEYPGWATFSQELVNILECLKSADFIENFFRVGIRCIDFFKSNIFDGIQLSIHLNGERFETNQTNITSIIQKGDYLSRLQIVNNSEIAINNNVEKGSLIDTDTYCEKEFQFDCAMQLANHCHIVQKELFFSLLKDDFLKSFNPEY